MKKLFLRICGLGLLLVQPICGQNTTQAKPDTAGRRAWIVATEMPKDLPNPLPVLTGDELLMVRMHMRSVDRAIPIDDTGLIRAVKSSVGDDGKVSYEALSRSVVPEGVREALIVLVPTDKKSDGLRFKSKVIDLSKFKKGGCLYINLTTTNLGIEIGEQRTAVKPGGMSFINPLDKEKKGVYPIRFFYEVPKEPKAEWKLMTSSKIAIFESRREICIFYYNSNIENVDFRGIPFMTPPPRPKPKNP